MLGILYMLKFKVEWRAYIMKKKVTIQDIADELGISRNTVSKAINNSGGLAPATREKIIQKAMEMDYKQFSYVKSLAGITSSGIDSNTSATEYQGEIALLTGQFFNQSHFASLMLDKFQEELSSLGFTMNIHRVTERNMSDLSLPVTFRKDQIKGIICIEMFDRRYDDMLCTLDIPLLFVDGPSNADGELLAADQLYMDNVSGILAFVKEMLKRGYRRFGFIGDFWHCQSFFERYCAYRLALMQFKVEIEDKFFICSNGPYGESLNSLDELPEVFLCANDFVAIDAISALRDRGISVPDDVLFCGFDDSHESRHMLPTLTTIHIHTQIMAYEAVHLLMSRMKESSLDYRIVHTQTDLIYRASTKD